MTDSGNGQPQIPIPSIITVPDLPAREQVRRACERFREVAEEYEDWPFLDAMSRGASFKTRIERFDRTVQTKEVHRSFLRKGFDGNVAAFIRWIIEANVRGWYACIPTKPDWLWRRGNGVLCAPCLLGDELIVTNINAPWSPSWIFVGFRRIRSST